MHFVFYKFDLESLLCVIAISSESIDQAKSPKSIIFKDLAAATKSCLAVAIFASGTEGPVSVSKGKLALKTRSIPLLGMRYMATNTLTLSAT